jgi:Ran GTPase-activating protein (RanGAP) involved in mRNA processing and transport
LANNNLGALVLPTGWEEDDGVFFGPDDEGQSKPPPASSPTGSIAIANAISDMRALSKFDISSNSLCAAGAKVLAEALKGNQVINEINMSSNYLGKAARGRYADSDMSGVTALADAIPGMGALSSVNLLKNVIGIEQAESLGSMLKEHPTLKSLCGNKGDEAELDMSGKMHGAGDAIMLGAEIVDNTAISSVNLLKNAIPVEQAQELVKIMQSKEKLEAHYPVRFERERGHA